MAGVAQVLVALALMRSADSALSQALTVASLVNGPVLGVFLIGAFTRRAGTAAALAGMAAGVAASLAAWLGTSVAWPWYAAIGSLTTLAVGSVMGALRPRESRA